MDISKEITRRFDAFVKKTFPNREIQNFLIRHERRHIVEANLLKEIKKSFHVIHDAKTIEGLIDSITFIFCQAALEHEEKRIKGIQSKSEEKPLEGVIGLEND